MLTKSTTALRRTAGYVMTLLFSGFSMSAGLIAQVPTVVSSSPVVVPHTGPYGAPWQNTVSNRGDFVLFDFKTGGMYQFPGTGGAQITVGAPGKIAGGFTDSGIAIDPRNNNLYLDNNYNGGLLEFPYDAATGTWDLPSKSVASGISGNLGGSCGNYFQSVGLNINDNGIMAVATENGCGVEIFTVPIDLAGNFGTATPIIANLKARAKTVAIDDAGNVYWNEDAGGVAGALYVAAGTTGLNGESGAIRVDPNLTSVQGVAVDRAGSVYIADGSAGEYLVPLKAGIPNPTQAVLLSTAPAQGNASIDQAHGILFVPISTWNGFSDVVKIYLNRAEFGSVAVGTSAATPTTIYYSFSGAVTPASFAIEESGTSADFSIGTGGTCIAGSAYAGGSSCTLVVNFMPHTIGSVSASLAMLDAKGNVLTSTVLHGVSQGPTVFANPASESAIGSGLKTPTQVASDAAGNIYVADSGQPQVLEYNKGAGATSMPIPVGTGLIAPTGVAVDGTGNVFIADSGSVVEVPFGPTGLISSGQTVVKTGLGANVRLAVDGIGDVFVADPANQRVAILRNLVVGETETDISGLKQLTAIAADRSGNLFIANGTNLIQVSSFGSQTTLLTTLPAANGLAVDESGSLYVATSTGTIRIPMEAGALTPTDQITLASTFTKPTGVAVDTTGNAYVINGTVGSVDLVSTNGFLNLGTLATTTSTQSGTVQLVNSGNAPLTITGFSSTADYSVSATNCVGSPVAVGLSCTATVLFSPGAGDQGNLTGQLLVQGNAADLPVGINLIGIGAGLAASTSTVTVTKPTVTNAPVAVTVVAASGTGPVATGSVVLTVTGNGLTTPITYTKPLTNGTVSFSATELAVGSYTFTVNYAGDRVYGTSKASTTASVTTGTVVINQPVAATVPIYVLSGGQGSQEPYDGSQMPYYYNYPVSVSGADGNPLVGTPTVNAAGIHITDYGNVTYQVSSGSPVCSGTAAIISVQANGTAPFPASCLSINTSNNQIPNLTTTYTLTPVYKPGADVNYGSVTGTPVTFIALRNPMVLITANPGTLSLAAGSAATANLTLTSLLGYGIAGAASNLNNYSLPLELECDNLPAHASCSFSYPVPDPSDANSVAVTTTTPGKVVMTIATNVPVGTSTASLGRTGLVFAGMFGLTLLGLSRGRKRTLRAMLFTVSLLTASFFGLSACSSANITASPTLTTPKGTYNVTVTAKQVGSKVVPGSFPGTTQVVQGNGNQMSVPFSMSVQIQ